MKRILVVEDEPHIAFALETDLRQEGHAVKVATDGEQALRLAAGESFDLIVLDIMLPGRDGFEVCRDLRRHDTRTPVLMLTARTQEAEKVMGLELGADDYLTKPFSPRELRARVKALLRRAAPEISETFTFGDVAVDFGRGEVRRAGRLVDVSALEFRLLGVFIARRGRVLSRQQLLDAAWGANVTLNDRVVDNHIVALRKKLEPDPARPRFLVNLRGLGYRFDP